MTLSGQNRYSCGRGNVVTAEAESECRSLVLQIRRNPEAVMSATALRALGEGLLRTVDTATTAVDGHHQHRVTYISTPEYDSPR